MTADVAHLLNTPFDTIRRERWSSLLAWHEEARRIAEAQGITGK